MKGPIDPIDRIINYVLRVWLPNSDYELVDQPEIEYYGPKFKRGGDASSVASAGVRPGQLVVIGAGKIGLLAAMAAEVAGASPVISIDLVESRLQTAFEVGVDTALNAGQVDVVAEVAIRQCWQYRDLTPSLRSFRKTRPIGRFFCPSPPVSVRRPKAALSSGCKSHPATAPARSQRSDSSLRRPNASRSPDK
ncbi:MAG: hypothetical protein V3U43_09720 [Pseudomonadales bacterium]